MSVFISKYTLTCALGNGLAAISRNIVENRSGLKKLYWNDCDIDTHFGVVSGLDAKDNYEIPNNFYSRNNMLARIGLEQDGFADSVSSVIDKYGATRCGVIIGSSTSSIGRTEQAYKNFTSDGLFKPEFIQPDVHHPHTASQYVANFLGTRGPEMTVSTACSSSAKVFCSAARWLKCGFVDAVVIGGVDTLCESIIYGFNSLQLISNSLCKPFDINRSGINLGESAGFAILTRDAGNGKSYPKLLGYGESCDAYHMSSAHPEGIGAILSMQNALNSADLSVSDVDYINLHGTGTLANDSTEGIACHSLFKSTDVLASATKGWTGHTLGASGITEAILTLNAMETEIIPSTINSIEFDSCFAEHLMQENLSRKINIALSNSFGFGGNNCTLIFGGGV